MLASAFSFCRAEGSRRLCRPPKVSAPLMPFLFSAIVAGVLTPVDAELWAELHLWCYNTLFFLHPKWCIFCSNVRFWAFSTSKCVMYLRRHSDEGDAGCALVRMGKKRAVSRPMMPHDGTPWRGMWRRGAVQCLEDVIRGNFTGKNVS